MLVIDASCLVEVVTGTARADTIRTRMAQDDDHAAPGVIDVEVLNVVRDQALRGRIDATLAAQAIADLRDWPGQRFPHGLLIDRAWQLRATVRGPDAFYVALAEMLNATLLTLDERLARAPGPTCRIDTLESC